MRRIRAALLGLIGLAALPMPMLHAQGLAGPSAAADASGTAVVAPTQNVLGTATYSGSAPVGPFGGYLYFRKDIGTGVGYQQGYSNVGWFQPFQTTENGAAFAQGQFFVTDQGKWGGNIGGGYRHYFDSIDRIIGGYAFYDANEGPRGVNYDQIGIGFQTLGRRWDFRTNGYFPLSKDVHMLGIAGPFGANPSFVGNHLLFTGAAYFEKAMPGGDAEIGLPIFDPSAFGRLRVYFGGYVYDSPAKNPAGIRARLESHLNQYFTIGASFMHDDVNGTLATLAVDIRSWSKNLPPITNYRPNQRPKLYLPEVRQYQIATTRFIDDFTAEALGPGQQPLEFVWVDNSNPNTGDGTFENPFHDMPTSAPGANYILVRQGDSSTFNPVQGGIALEDGQELYGEGVRFMVLVTSTKFGPAPLGGNYNIQSLIPSWDLNGNYPFISNPSGDVIRLASNNTAAGFNIIDSLGHGITGANINNFELFGLNIGNANGALGNGGTAVFLTNAAGAGTIDNFTFLNNAGGGLIIDNSNTSPLTLTLKGNTSVDPNVVGGDVALSLFADNSTISATFPNYRATGTGAGMILSADNGGVIDATGSNSTFNDTTVSDGIQVLADNGSTVNLDLLDTTAVNAARHGLNIEVTDGSLVTGVFDTSGVGNSSFSGAAQMGVRLIAADSSNPLNSLLFNNTTVNGSGSDGLHFEVVDGSEFTVAFHNGQVNMSGGNGISDYQDVNSILNLDVDPTSITSSTLNGFWFDLHTGATLNASFTDVSMSGSGSNGILGELESGAVANLNITNMDLNSSGLHGMSIQAMSGAIFSGDVRNISILDSDQQGMGRNGIDFFVDNASADLVLGGADVGNSAFSNSTDNGFHFLVQNAGSLDVTGQTGFGAPGNNFSNNLFDGVAGEVHDAMSLASLVFPNSISDDNGQRGIDVLADTQSTLFVQMTNGSIANNGLDGVRMSANDATADLVLSLVSVESNGARGIDLLSENGADLTATLASGSALGNFSDGIRMMASNSGSSAELIATGTRIDNNGGRGIDLAADDGATLDATVRNNASVSNNMADGIGMSATNSNTMASLTVDLSTVSRNGIRGIDLDASDGAALSAQIFGSSVSNNVSDGVRLLATDMNTSADLSAVSANIDNNGDFGIDMTVSNAATLSAALTSSSVSGNTSDGVQLLAEDVLTVASLDIDSTAANNNGENGYDLLVQTGAQLDVTVTNFARGSNNFENGLRFTALDTFGDGTTATLNMTGNNTFSDNQTGSGVRVSVSDLAMFQAAVSGGMTNNGQDGLRVIFDNVTNVSSLTVGGPGDITNNSGNGISINITDSGVTDLRIIGKTISDNNASGIVVVSNGSTIADGRINFNTIQSNSGRGLNILNQGTSDTNLAVLSNLIDMNGNEGVYIMNTASTTQSAAFGAPVLADGAVDAIPRLILNFTGNAVTNNGGGATTVGAGGFVLRVGTSDGGTDYTDPGGFASTRGGVVASVNSNSFVGNTGNDVYFGSFTSTVNPSTTGGAWNDGNDNPRIDANDTFTPTGFQNDPLARLDLIFNGNTGDQAAFNNIGASYANNEPVFKSRTQGQDGNDPDGPPYPVVGTDDDGPFAAGTRVRNAQRLAGRSFPSIDLPPSIAQGADFLFPGIGQSTFRVNASGNTFVSGAFLFDAFPYNNPATDANGVGTYGNGPFGIDDMPWGWSILP